jgi:hypothetical protein
MLLLLHVDGLVFFSEHCGHGLDFLLLFGNAGDSIGCFGGGVVVDYGAETFFEDGVEVGLGVVHDGCFDMMNFVCLYL